MPYVCRSCDYFDEQGANASGCPTCGGTMRFTMLNPKATATATLEPPEVTKEEWRDPYQFGYEEIEAPWSFRYAQIGIGIATYFAVSRFIAPVLMLPIATGLEEVSVEAQVIVAALLTIGIYSVAALAGGAAAGAWARNWIPQGLGVAAGVLFIPMMMILVFAPENWPLFLISLVITSVLTVLGAYIGHLVVKPTRIPKV